MVVGFRINTTALAVGLGKSVPKNDKNFTYHMVPHACLLLHEPEKTETLPRLVLVRARTAVKTLLGYSTEKI